MDKEQHEIRVHTKWFADTLEEVKNCLIGNILTTKAVNAEILRSVFQKPWPFNKSLVVLIEYDGLTSAKMVNMDYGPLWVQIHGLPIRMMNEKIAIVLADSMGDVEEVDVKEGSMA
ncbi:hypothetical protein REPUB_Repub03eG0121200 [Reevesia pubescens]